MVIPDLVGEDPDEPPETSKGQTRGTKDTSRLGRELQPSLGESHSYCPDTLSTGGKDEQVGELFGIKLDSTGERVSGRLCIL